MILETRIDYNRSIPFMFVINKSQLLQISCSYSVKDKKLKFETPIGVIFKVESAAYYRLERFQTFVGATFELHVAI